MSSVRIAFAFFALVPGSIALAAGVAERPERVQPLLIGASMPGTVVVHTDRGVATNLVEAMGGKPAMLIFHRGGWCPYCDMQLSELRLIEAELRSLGYQIIAITPDPPRALRARAAKESAAYQLLSDQSSALAEAFGIAFRVDAALLRASSSANPRTILPVPAVFIVDAGGTVRFQYVTPDYRVLVPKELLLVAAKVSLRP